MTVRLLVAMPKPTADPELGAHPPRSGDDPVRPQACGEPRMRPMSRLSYRPAMSTAPNRWALARPPVKGAAEGADLGVVQHLGDMADREIRSSEQPAGNLATYLVGHLPERAAFGLQVPVKGPAIDREEIGDLGR